MTERRRDMRASDADRDEAVEHLRRAAHEGRLRVEELDDRVGRALSARTYGQLDAIVSDLPARRALINHSARTMTGALRASSLARQAARAGVVRRFPRRSLITGALATIAVAVPLTVTETGTHGPSVRMSHAGSRPMPSWLRYDLREENNPNAPHPPVYYVLKANEGKQ
jgi:hypothetical protein